ncbi:hypothetical protein DDB_G0273305 [Dictyostelium discoideum AX4]|uniref:Acetyl-CoA synthetase-like protein n=1 Tax=Dictyostelium discoideum TaxID=44689 RepID=Q557A7_DICDI|nr:hypothetical protein DDB_G0273691 [Dictyostelium discoideum AX4]XP_644788.1 hypothetical protein DDB_G0273305 [Dictyostelium discoideum AX4]EAL70536.1 hypothetical protein DDB_G0273691 [Dictyostelium discoideum AX4]EAL70870.1 hypothetical protein DDB_G0273305 [Dictyostelium discoideum AX4]|eukprot:XP_644462.1 hypothetical protein DDB_G0273691 [Dictyostelium discoideum AX4]
MYKLSDPFNYVNDSNYANSYPEDFWDEVAKKHVFWDKMYDKVYSGDEIYPDWFKGGELNTCYNLLDIHTKNPTKRDQDAIIYECPFLKKTEKLTYYQLYEKVCEFSRVLLNLNVSKNDVVLIYMSNTLEPLIAMLSCARIGATHCTIIDGYSVKSLIDRIETITPELIITTNYGISNDEIITFTPNLKEAIELSTFKPSNVITLFRNEVLDETNLKKVNDIPTIPNTLSWYDEIKKLKENNQSPFYEYVPVESSHSLYILYTSGTTGNAKAVVRSNGPHLVSIRYYRFRKESDIPQIVFSYSNIGWVSFHGFFYGLLSVGNTFVMYEGGIINNKHIEDDLWKTIVKHKVTHTFPSPSVFRYLIKTDPEGKIISSKYDLSNLEEIWCGSEVIEESIPEYIEQKLKIKCLRVFGQSEIGITSFISVHALNMPYKATGIPSIFIKPSILSEEGKVLNSNEIGFVAIKLPMPPGFATTYYKNDEKFKQLFSKFPGYYNTGDLGYKDQRGFYTIVSRSDDQIKIGYKKVQLNTIETSILKHPSVLECCSIGIYDPVIRSVPIGVLVLKENQSIDLIKLQNEINNIITQDIESCAVLRKILIVNQLPKTKVGKIPRLILSNLLNDSNYQLPHNVSDTEIFYEIKELYMKNL